MSYTVNEGTESFTFDVEVKNNRSFAIPIEYTVNDNGGEALGELSQLLDM